MLGTYARALAAVCTSSRNVERADDVEHILLEAVRGSLVVDARLGVIEHAVLAGTRGTYIPTRIAAYALGELVAPEVEALLRGHILELFHHFKAVRVEHIAVLADELVENDVLLALT